MNVDGADREVTVAVPSTTFRFAESIPVDVRHQNNSADSWTLIQPNKSLRMKLSFSVSTSNAAKGSEHFVYLAPLWTDQIHPTTGEVYQVILDPPRGPKITIAGKDKHAFIYDIFLLDDIYRAHPGQWKIWAENSLENLRSSDVSFQIVFSEESVDTLLAMVSQGSDRYGALHWLRKIKPDLELWFIKPDPRILQEYIDKYAEHDRKALGEFSDWWKENRRKPVVTKLIDSINRDYGLDPTEARKSVAALKPMVKFKPSEQAPANKPEKPAGKK